MTIDWNSFTPWTSLGGGVIIGFAAAMFALLNGRIAGISGVLGGLLKPVRGDISWCAAFIAGLVGAPLLYALFTELPRSQIDAGDGALIGGNVTFLEPMVTLDYLKTKPAFSVPVPRPAAYLKAGACPASYSVKYDAAARTFEVSLDDLR